MYREQALIKSGMGCRSVPEAAQVPAQRFKSGIHQDGSAQCAYVHGC